MAFLRMASRMAPELGVESGLKDLALEVAKMVERMARWGETNIVADGFVSG